MQYLFICQREPQKYPEIFHNYLINAKQKTLKSGKKFSLYFTETCRSFFVLFYDDRAREVTDLLSQ